MGSGRCVIEASGQTLPPKERAASIPISRPTPEYSAPFIRRFTRVFWAFARVWFRPRIEGIERIPPAPCMFVGNHSGYGIMEIFTLLSIWTRRFSTDRPVAGLSHDVGLRWPLRWGVVRIGGVRASPKAVLEILSRGFDVLVFPGGDIDALRPFSARYQVHWGRRSGFVRTASDAGVPIVPVVNCGSHAQFTLLPGGSTIARWIGFERFRIHTWPMPLGSVALLAALLGWGLGGLGAAWVLAGFLVAFVPNPTRMHIRFLEAIDARGLVKEHGGDETAVAESLRRKLENTLRALAQERRTPWG